MTQHSSTKRPERTRIRNELGQAVTLGAGIGQFDPLLRQESPEATLILGIGPDPVLAAEAARGRAPIYYMEAQNFQDQMPPTWANQIPASFKRLNYSDLQTILHSHSLEILSYRQNIRLFPSFWAPIFALCRMRLSASPPIRSLKKSSILLMGQQKGLLVKELAAAFSNAGFAVRTCEESPGQEVAQLTHELRTEPPALILSVNFAGLDSFGEAAAMAQTAESRLAVWCVDNPWHLLSKLKAPFWKKLPIFVTDDYFCSGLQAAGADMVEHLPLAAWPQNMLSENYAPDTETEVLFVGRSAFPGRDRFFAGLTPPAELMETALRLLQQGKRPDFSWWIRVLELTSLWPGKDVRLAGLCAEECAWRLRLLSLQQAAECARLTVCGDTAWEEHLQGRNGVSFIPPVDYYGPLMRLYSGARYTLNMTSLLLPHGLTQRHFDVWSAGGFLLTDTTPGLAIFPQELTRPISFTSASGATGLSDTILRLEKDKNLRKDLTKAWQSLIAQSHTYDARVATIIEKIHIK